MKSTLLASFLILNTILGFSQEIKIRNQQPFLIGKITVEDLSSNSYKDWFLPNLENYNPKTEKLETIKEAIANYKILVFMGTWCGDSKREVPRFIKILQKINFPFKNLKIVAVDKRKEEYKKSPQGEEWGLHIKRVPTFIFYKNGREINRIVESPVRSLEEDIIAIIKQEKYSPNYSKSLHFD